MLIKLVADKEEAEVAKVIDKTIRRQPGVGNRDARALGRTHWSRQENVARGRGNSGRQPLKCYSCGQPGHFAVIVIRKCSSLRLYIVLSLGPSLFFFLIWALSILV